MTVDDKQVVPGDEIFKFEADMMLGPGLQLHNGLIRATLLGTVKPLLIICASIIRGFCPKIYSCQVPRIIEV